MSKKHIHKCQPSSSFIKKKKLNPKMTSTLQNYHLALALGSDRVGREQRW